MTWNQMLQTLNMDKSMLPPVTSKLKLNTFQSLPFVTFLDMMMTGFSGVEEQYRKLGEKRSLLVVTGMNEYLKEGPKLLYKIFKKFLQEYPESNSPAFFDRRYLMKRHLNESHIGYWLAWLQVELGCMIRVANSEADAEAFQQNVLQNCEITRHLPTPEAHPLPAPYLEEPSTSLSEALSRNSSTAPVSEPTAEREVIYDLTNEQPMPIILDDDSFVPSTITAEIHSVLRNIPESPASRAIRIGENLGNYSRPTVAMSPPPVTPAGSPSPGKRKRCGLCQGEGHTRNSKSCPLYYSQMAEDLRETKLEQTQRQSPRKRSRSSHQDCMAAIAQLQAQVEELQQRLQAPPR